MGWLFQLVPDAELTCRGTQQPMYLFSNLVITACIISLASADVLGPFRFRRRWETLVASRDGGRPSPIAVFGEKVENIFVYVLRALGLLVTRRPLQLGMHTSYCKDQPITIITFLIAVSFFPIITPIMLSSFMPSVGPAPPLRLQRVAVDDLNDEYWKDLEPQCTDLERCRAHHRVFSRTGVLRRGWRAGGIRYVARTTLWKCMQIVKITVALWDEHALLATRGFMLQQLYA